MYLYDLPILFEPCYSTLIRPISHFGSYTYRYHIGPSYIVIGASPMRILNLKTIILCCIYFYRKMATDTKRQNATRASMDGTVTPCSVLLDRSEVRYLL